MPEVTRHKLVQSAKNKESIQPVEYCASSKPTAQLAPKSSLGTILSTVAMRYKQYLPSEQGSDSEEEDPSSSDSGSYYSDDSSMPSEHKHWRQCSCKKTQKKHSWKSWHDTNAIKPIPPKEYDGSVDPRSYHQFIMEGEAYLCDGKVWPRQQVRLLAHYLKGKAYDFFMQKVATDSESWDLQYSSQNFLIIAFL